MNPEDLTPLEPLIQPTVKEEVLEAAVQPDLLPATTNPSEPINEQQITDTEEPLKQNYFARRIDQIREMNANLSRNQKFARDVGVMALSTMILPAIGVLDGGSHAQASANLLEGEFLAAFTGLNVVAYRKLYNLKRQGML